MRGRGQFQISAPEADRRITTELHCTLFGEEVLLGNTSGMCVGLGEEGLRRHHPPGTCLSLPPRCLCLNARSELLGARRCCLVPGRGREPCALHCIFKADRLRADSPSKLGAAERGREPQGSCRWTAGDPGRPELPVVRALRGPRRRRLRGRGRFGRGR